MANDILTEAKVFTRVALIRFAISLVSTAVVAWGVSFWVSGYVVRANIAGMNAAFSGVQEALDQINNSIQANTSEMTKLTGQSSTQGTEISYLRRDLSRVEKAVQNFGISIPAVGSVDGGFVINTAKWDELQKIFGSSGKEPVFIELKEPSLK